MVDRWVLYGKRGSEGSEVRFHLRLTDDRLFNSKWVLSPLRWPVFGHYSVSFIEKHLPSRSVFIFSVWFLLWNLEFTLYDSHVGPVVRKHHFIRIICIDGAEIKIILCVYLRVWLLYFYVIFISYRVIWGDGCILRIV